MARRELDFDHWESACTNPCSEVTPEEIANAYVREQDWYSNGIAHYIECREGYDRLLDLESFGGKIRDTEGEFEGAEFRDEKTGLCLPMITRINLRSVSGEPRLSRLW